MLPSLCTAIQTKFKGQAFVCLHTREAAEWAIKDLRTRQRFPFMARVVILCLWLAPHLTLYLCNRQHVQLLGEHYYILCDGSWRQPSSPAVVYAGCDPCLPQSAVAPNGDSRNSVHGLPSTLHFTPHSKLHILYPVHHSMSRHA